MVIRPNYYKKGLLRKWSTRASFKSRACLGQAKDDLVNRVHYRNKWSVLGYHPFYRMRGRYNNIYRLILNLKLMRGNYGTE